jgi:hypothetical protein
VNAGFMVTSATSLRPHRPAVVGRIILQQKNRLLVVDMTASSQIVENSRTVFFFGLNAKVEMTPVMALEDLEKGLSNIEGIVQRYGWRRALDCPDLRPHDRERFILCSSAVHDQGFKASAVVLSLRAKMHQVGPFLDDLAGHTSSFSSATMPPTGRGLLSVLLVAHLFHPIDRLAI